ncbi:iron ABC transporter permease [Aquabacter sp. CN5-332]|uniref:ABC transporter permease n=1 Tax=Aquabacter sp. CN5-332 TaxID=3156608 RepID=UPI0032B47736
MASDIPSASLPAMTGHAPVGPSLFQRLGALWSGERILWLLLAIFVIAVAIVPLVYAVDAAFYRETRIGLSDERSLAAFIHVYTSSEYLGYLAETLILSAVVTAFSLVVGVTMSILVWRTDLPFKGAMDLLIIMPLFLSPFAGLIAWVALGSGKTGFLNVAAASAMRAVGLDPVSLINIWSYGGVVWVMFLFFCPFAYLFTSGSFRAMDSSLEEAARITGASAIQALLRISVPMATPAILASGLLIFILAAEMYTIPGIIGSTTGFTTLPWKIYQDSTTFPVHRAHAAAAGTLLLWVTFLGVWIQRRITQRSERYVSVTGKGFRAKPLKLGGWKAPAFIAIGLYILCADLLPFGSLLLSSVMRYSAPAITWDIFTLEHYQRMFGQQDMRDALWNTIGLAIGSGVICVLVGFVISFMELRRPKFSTSLVAFLGVLPVAVPGLVYGIGLLWIYLQTPLYGSVWILLLAYTAKFLPYGILVSRSSILQLHPDLEQSARVAGAGSLTVLRLIVLPLMKGTLVAILFFVMIQSTKELSASILLYSERSQVLSVLTWHYMDNGNYQYAAAVGLVQTLIMMVMVIITRLVFRVQLERAIAKT